MLFAAVIAFACLSRCSAGITRPFIERQISEVLESTSLSRAKYRRGKSLNLANG